MSDMPLESGDIPEVARSFTIRANYVQKNIGPDSGVQRPWLSEGRAFESPDAARPQGAQKPDAGDDDPVPETPVKASHWRTPGPPEALLIVTRNWLAQLPETLRPQELVRLFPRIANNLGGQWLQPPVCATYLRSLLTDTRNGTRTGFPKRVAAELAALLAGIEAATVKQNTQPRGEAGYGVDVANPAPN